MDGWRLIDFVFVQIIVTYEETGWTLTARHFLCSTQSRPMQWMSIKRAIVPEQAKLNNTMLEIVLMKRDCIASKNAEKWTRLSACTQTSWSVCSHTSIQTEAESIAIKFCLRQMTAHGSFNFYEGWTLMLCSIYQQHISQSVATTLPRSFTKRKPCDMQQWSMEVFIVSDDKVILSSSIPSAQRLTPMSGKEIKLMIK